MHDFTRLLRPMAGAGGLGRRAPLSELRPAADPGLHRRRRTRAARSFSTVTNCHGLPFLRDAHRNLAVVDSLGFGRIFVVSKVEASCRCTESVRESGAKWMSGGAERQCNILDSHSRPPTTSHGTNSSRNSAAVTQGRRQTFRCGHRGRARARPWRWSGARRRGR
jgi:hypothetical protein